MDIDDILPQLALVDIQEEQREAAVDIEAPTDLIVAGSVEANKVRVRHSILFLEEYKVWLLEVVLLGIQEEFHEGCVGDAERNHVGLAGGDVGLDDGDGLANAPFGDDAVGVFEVEGAFARPVQSSRNVS
jgi:hypothetical protein